MKAHFRHQTKILVLGILTIGLLLTGCQAALEPVQRKSGDLNVSIDPRIELLTVVQQQADYKLLTSLDYAYVRESKETFKAFKNDEAVKQFKAMSSDGFSYHCPPAAMLYRSMPNELSANEPFSEDLCMRAGGEENLETFMKEMALISKHSNFSKFYRNHKSFYQEQVDSVFEVAQKEALTSKLNDFYKMDHGSYNLILSPLQLNGGYAWKLKNGDGKIDFYGFIGPDSVSKDLPTFSEEAIRCLVLHEFSHAYVNPLTTLHQEDVQALEALFVPIEKTMTEQAYGSWENTLNEHIIRAINARLELQNYGEAATYKNLQREYDKGFIYIKPIYDAIVIYEENRETYKTFDAFYPEILKKLEIYKTETIQNPKNEWTLK